MKVAHRDNRFEMFFDTLPLSRWDIATLSAIAIPGRVGNSDDIWNTLRDHSFTNDQARTMLIALSCVKRGGGLPGEIINLWHDFLEFECL